VAAVRASSAAAPEKSVSPRVLMPS
jgi:hypothetical protein